MSGYASDAVLKLNPIARRDGAFPLCLRTKPKEDLEASTATVDETRESKNTVCYETSATPLA